MQAQVYDYLHFFRERRKDRKANPTHIAIYYYLLEECNRYKWIEEFEVNVAEAVKQIGVDPHTWYKHIKTMEEHGYILYNRVPIPERKKRNPTVSLQSEAFKNWKIKKDQRKKSSLVKQGNQRRNSSLGVEQPTSLNDGII